MVRRDEELAVVLLRDGAEVARWPLSRPDRAHLDDVDRLARLQLAAGRLGCRVELVGPPAELSALLGLLGLSELFGQAEDGEQVGVEEVVVPDDPVA